MENTFVHVELYKDRKKEHSKKEKNENRYLGVRTLRKNFLAGLVYLAWIPLTEHAEFP